MKVYTAHVCYRGPNRLNITWKTGDQVFAPTRELANAYRYGGLPWEEYEDEYHQLMRRSLKANRARWSEVLAQDEVVLCCYCDGLDYPHCHRFLLASYFVKLGATYGGELGLTGEDACTCFNWQRS